MRHVLIGLAALALLAVGVVGGMAVERATDRGTSPARHLSPTAPTHTLLKSNPHADDFTITVGTTTTPARPAGQGTATQAARSILLPAACTIDHGIVTATGTFNGGFAPQGYVRRGDVVELYVYSSRDLQLANVTTERPYPMRGTSPWKVSATLDKQLLAEPGNGPSRCVVTVQPTHAFMGAGNA